MSAPPRVGRRCSISSLMSDDAACRTGIIYLLPPLSLNISLNGYRLVSPPLWGTVSRDGTFVHGEDGSLEKSVRGALLTRPNPLHALVREDVWNLLSDLGGRVVKLMPKRHPGISEQEIMETLREWSAHRRGQHLIPRMIQEQVRAGGVEVTEELARIITDTARVEVAMMELRTILEPMPPIQGWTDEQDARHAADCLDAFVTSQWFRNKQLAESKVGGRAREVRLLELLKEYTDGLMRIYAAQATRISARISARDANSEVLEELYGLIDGDSIDLAIDLLIERTDDLLSAGEFDQCNSLLIALDPSRLDTNLCVGVLSATRRARELLSSRGGLVRAVRGRLRELAPDRTERLLENLT